MHFCGLGTTVRVQLRLMAVPHAARYVAQEGHLEDTLQLHLLVLHEVLQTTSLCYFYIYQIENGITHMLLYLMNAEEL